MSIRTATQADASSIAAISVEVWLGTYLRHGVSGFFADYALAQFTTANVTRQLSDPNDTLFVSQNRDGIDGFIRITTGVTAPVESCSTTEISTFYVQPRHHGKGLGKALLAKAFEHCGTIDAPSVWLTTNAENTPAIAFYLAQGFQQVGQTHFRIQDQAYLNVVLSRPLGF